MNDDVDAMFVSAMPSYVAVSGLLPETAERGYVGTYGFSGRVSMGGELLTTYQILRPRAHSERR